MREIEKMTEFEKICEMCGVIPYPESGLGMTEEGLKLAELCDRIFFYNRFTKDLSDEEKEQAVLRCWQEYKRRLRK